MKPLNSIRASGSRTARPISAFSVRTLAMTFPLSLARRYKTSMRSFYPLRKARFATRMTNS